MVPPHLLPNGLLSIDPSFDHYFGPINIIIISIGGTLTAATSLAMSLINGF